MSEKRRIYNWQIKSIKKKYVRRRDLIYSEENLRRVSSYMMYDDPPIEQ